MNELDALRNYATRKGAYAANLNEVGCWQSLARLAGVNSPGNLNEMGAMRAILGAGAYGLSETSCLRRLCNAEGCYPVEGLDRPALLEALADPETFRANHLPPEPEPEPDTSITNAEKLSLPVATAVGTQVSVSDGFVSSSPTHDQIGFFVNKGQTQNGKPIYGYVFNPGYGGFSWSYRYTGTIWAFYQDDDAQDFALDEVEVESPWLADWGSFPYPLTHPALQQFNAASTAQGGVFVAGGTQDGVYTTAGIDGGFGRMNFGLLGQDTVVGAIDPYAIGWNGDESRWQIMSDSGMLYYSLSDVATPDLASDWKNASDDTPASITVTSLSAGDLVAGFKISTVTYIVDGAVNGRNKYSDVLGVAVAVVWDPAEVKWRYFDDGPSVNIANVAFPWVGTPEVTVDKSNVAAEENWGEIP